MWQSKMSFVPMFSLSLRASFIVAQNATFKPSAMDACKTFLLQITASITDLTIDCSSPIDSTLKGR